MIDTFKRVWGNIYLRVLLIVALSYQITVVLKSTQIAWSSFLIAFLIAYLFEPFVRRLEQAKLVARWLSVALTVLLILVFFVVGAILLGNILVELSNLPGMIIPYVTGTLPDQLDALQLWIIERTPPRVLNLVGEVPSVSSILEQQRSPIALWIRNNVGNLVGAVRFVFGGLGRGLVIITLAAFIMLGYKSMQSGFQTVFPERHRPFATELFRKIDKTVGGYVRAKFLESVIIGFVVWIVLLILNVPEAPAIAFIAAILNPIPYLGPAVATIPATLSALTIDWQHALLTLIVMGIIQGLDGNILAPILLSQSISVNPVTVLVSVLAGGALFGFWGILLSIPFAAFLQLLYTDYYLQSDWYLGKTKEKASLDVAEP